MIVVPEPYLEKEWLNLSIFLCKQGPVQAPGRELTRSQLIKHYLSHLATDQVSLARQDPLPTVFIVSPRRWIQQVKGMRLLHIAPASCGMYQSLCSSCKWLMLQHLFFGIFVFCSLLLCLFQNEQPDVPRLLHIMGLLGELSEIMHVNHGEQGLPQALSKC